MRPTLSFCSMIVVALATASAACSGGGDGGSRPEPPLADIEVVKEGAGPPPPPTIGIVLPTPVDGVVVLANFVIPVILRNSAPEAIEARLIADVQASGAFNQVDLGTFEVQPNADREIPVALRVLGVIPESLENSAGIGFRVIVDGPSGEPLDGFALPTYYVHRDGDTVVLYDEDVLIARYDGGDINGTFTSPGIPDPPPDTTKIFAGAGAGDPDPEVVPPILSSGEQSICVHWKYQSLGHHAGEKYYKNAEPMAARGVKVAVQSSNGTHVLFANRNNGCFTAALPDGLFQVIVHAQAVVGNGHDIMIRALELEEGENESASLPDSRVRKWVIKATTGPNTVHLYVPADDSSTMMAFGTFSAQFLDGQVPIAENSPKKLDVRLVPDRDNSEADQSSVYIAPSQLNIKFAVGHEVGHWYGQNNGFGTGAGYQVDSSDPDCASNNTNAPGSNAHDHLLRGVEFNGGAFKEGLAHALSAFIWNGVTPDAPRFRYYKDLDNLDAYNDLQADKYRVDMVARTDDANTLGGVRAWRKKMCTNPNLDEWSVELDWARFLVSFTDPDTPGGQVPTFAQLIGLLRATEAQLDELNSNTALAYDIYPTMLDVVDPAFKNRFTSLAQTYDVTKP